MMSLPSKLRIRLKKLRRKSKSEGNLAQRSMFVIIWSVLKPIR